MSNTCWNYSGFCLRACGPASDVVLIRAQLQSCITNGPASDVVFNVNKSQCQAQILTLGLQCVQCVYEMNKELNQLIKGKILILQYNRYTFSYSTQTL